MAMGATHFSTTANDRERRGPVTPTAAYKLLAELLRGADVGSSMTTVAGVTSVRPSAAACSNADR